MAVAILGFGRFGKLAARYLSDDCDVLVHSSRPEQEITKAGHKPVSLEEACLQDIVIPCVPICEFEATMSRIAPHLGKDTLVIDICSVKQHTVRIMEENLQKETQFLPTHPMFGPDSAAKSLEGQKMVLCRTDRIPEDRYLDIREYLLKRGLAIVETTPQEHDKDMAGTLALTHFIGRTLMEAGTEPRQVDTEGHRQLLRILSTVKNDSWQLFEDMCRYNPEVDHTLARFMDAAQKTRQRVSENT